MSTVLQRTWLAGIIAMLLIMAIGFVPVAYGNQPVLKIGVLGVMSGPAASWGLVNRYSAETTAQIINEKGGWDIGGTKYRIDIVSVDDRNDPKVAVSGAERLIYQEGVRYIIGPNVDTTAAAIVPVIERGNAISIPYAFSKALYSPPASNSILGMVASYQAGPIIYEYLMKEHGIQSISFVARNESDPLNQRDEGVEAARQLGLDVLSAEDTYEPGTTDFIPVMSRIVRRNPDLIVLSGVAPSDAPLLIRAARELGFQGFMSTETGQDAQILCEVAGSMADGFISVGGASTEEIRSPYMEEFIDRYTRLTGEWNDEAGTKVYALEMILRTLAFAGTAAIDDVAVFKQAIPDFEVQNPFLKEPTPLRYVGSAYFGQPRQIGVPMVVNVFESCAFRTLFTGSVE